MINMFLIVIIVIVAFWGSLIALILLIKRIFKPKHATSKHEERFCPNCGRSIPKDARTCPYCSKKFW